MNLIAGRNEAFGAPGIGPTWCSSDKDFVTTALGSSRLWATIGHGIVTRSIGLRPASRRSAIWGSILGRNGPLDRSEAGAPLPATHAGPRPPGAHHRASRR